MELKDLYYSIPLIIIAAGILLELVIEMFVSNAKKILPILTFFILLIAGYYSLFTINQKIGIDGINGIFNGMMNIGGRAHLFYFLFNFGGALLVLISLNYIRKIEIDLGEYYILLLSSILGMMFIAGARSLVMIFIGLEQMSICFYILAGFRRKNMLSNEASLKYFLLGSFATGFLVYGLALIFGSVGSLMLFDLYSNALQLAKNPLFLIGILLFLVGFTFKIAAFPFHLWAPDVYEGAPTSVSAFMATLGKAAAFSALLLIMPGVTSIGANNVFLQILGVISVLSMMYGSIVAIVQSDFKRMLAYSSIAHAGYMIIGLASGNVNGTSGIIFYLTAYTFMNIGAFGIIALLENSEGSFLKIENYRGLASRSPMLAGLMAVFLFALSGLPPFAGFFGKYYIFYAAIQSNQVWLALFGVLSSVISVYFYLRVIVLMYFSEPADDAPIGELSQSGLMAIGAALVLVIALGVMPGSLIELINLLN